MNIIEKIAYSTPLRMLTLYISMLVPKDKSLLLFGSWFGTKYADNAKYLFEYVLENRKDLHPVWMTTDDGVYAELKGLGYPVCKSGTAAGIKNALRACTVVYCTHDQEDIGVWESHFIGRSVLVNLWHGIPIKKIMYDDEYSAKYVYSKKDRVRDLILSVPLKKKYICSSSEEVSRIYKSAFRAKDTEVIETGQPRNDYFITPHKNTLRRRFGEKKIIVYLPTHRNAGKTPIDLHILFDLEEIDVILESRGAVLVIKKHPYHKAENKLEGEYKNIYELKEEGANTQELLDAADVLITDYSSCYIDYLFLNRPMIFYAYDYDYYIKEDRQLYFDYDSIVPGPIAKNYDQLKTEIYRILSGVDNYINTRKRIEKIFYGDNAGTLSSPRVLQMINK